MALVAGIAASALAHGGTAGLAAELLAVLVGIGVVAGALYVLGRRKIDEYAVGQRSEDKTGAEPEPYDEDATSL